MFYLRNSIITKFLILNMNIWKRYEGSYATSDNSFWKYIKSMKHIFTEICCTIEKYKKILKDKISKLEKTLLHK